MELALTDLFKPAYDKQTMVYWEYLHSFFIEALTGTYYNKFSPVRVDSQAYIFPA